ncbi:hypothetical protein Nepgr_022414 [Nepenthes gracilis]|uniref:Cupin type-1 domain-containing protein n=1 Tax=Nepenthes gracilis TaxID=150966 RepID=A0AAD3T080_NEPGR|nr:hypothetical protein Nepgr_022414 [Nepenthes gracilis]
MEKKGALLLALLLIASYVAYATDPTQLQDFCVGVNNPVNGVFVNGLFSRTQYEQHPMIFYSKDSTFQEIRDNKWGSNVTLVGAANLPGLNTLGISLARIDFAPYGLNPPHTHSTCDQVQTVLEGTLRRLRHLQPPKRQNQLFSGSLYPERCLHIPLGLIHFQFNIGKTPLWSL